MTYDQQSRQKERVGGLTKPFLSSYLELGAALLQVGRGAAEGSHAVCASRQTQVARVGAGVALGRVELDSSDLRGEACQSRLEKIAA